jgi:hypothetical protein
VRHRDTVAPICARLHLLRLITKRQAAKTLAQEAMVVASPRHRGTLDWRRQTRLAEKNDDEGDDFPRSEGSARGGDCLPHVAAVETTGARQNDAATLFAVARAREGLGLGFRSEE